MSNPRELATLRRRARSNRLEVQDILEAAKNRLPGLAETLEKLSAECGWSNERKPGPGGTMPPFRRWAAVASAFARGGCASLYELGKEPEYQRFVVRMLEHLHSPEALRTFLRLRINVIADPKADEELAHETARSLALFSANPPVRVSKANGRRIRGFIYSYLRLPDADRFYGMTALVAVGDKQSIEFIQAQPPLEFPWEHVTSEVLRAIAKRTRTKLHAPLPQQRYRRPQMKRGKDMFEAIAEAETNGDNYGISTEDIIARLKKWQSLCSFRISGVDYNAITLNFDTLPEDIKAFVRDAYELCPDLVQNDEQADLSALEKRLPETKRLELWWD